MYWTLNELGGNVLLSPEMTYSPNSFCSLHQLFGIVYEIPPQALSHLWSQLSHQGCNSKSKTRANYQAIILIPQYIFLSSQYSYLSNSYICPFQFDTQTKNGANSLANKKSIEPLCTHLRM